MNKRLEKAIIFSLAFLFSAQIVCLAEIASLSKETIKFQLRFQQGETLHYNGIIEITDISGVPTEG